MFSLCCVLDLVLCVGYSLCYVRDLVRVTCSLYYVLCALFSLCYVQFAVTNLVASLRACLASLAWLASLAFGSSTHARYLLCCEPRHTCHLYIYIYIYAIGFVDEYVLGLEVAVDD